MATSMLCDDPLFGSDSLFGGMSLDLEDLFSDDLMGALLGEHGTSELLVAPPSCMVPAAVEQPCSSGSGSGTALAARSPSPSRSTTSGQSQGAPVLQLALQRSAGPPTRTRRLQGAWACEVGLQGSQACGSNMCASPQDMPRYATARSTTCMLTSLLLAHAALAQAQLLQPPLLRLLQLPHPLLPRPQPQPRCFPPSRRRRSWLRCWAAP